MVVIAGVFVPVVLLVCIMFEQVAVVAKVVCVFATDLVCEYVLCVDVLVAEVHLCGSVEAVVILMVCESVVLIPQLVFFCGLMWW